LTFTPSPTATATNTPTPTFTPTPTVLCEVRIFETSRVNLRSGPSTDDEVVLLLDTGTELEVLDITQTDGFDWYFVRGQVEDASFEGWVRADLVIEDTDCP
jgi:uncharacterized protein YraI